MRLQINADRIAPFLNALGFRKKPGTKLFCRMVNERRLVFVELLFGQLVDDWKINVSATDENAFPQWDITLGLGVPWAVIRDVIASALNATNGNLE